MAFMRVRPRGKSTRTRNRGDDGSGFDTPALAYASFDQARSAA
jgi:hypothetical protein